MIKFTRIKQLKLEIGSKIIIRNDLIARCSYDGVYCNTRMINYCGKKTIIKSILKNTSGAHNNYRLDIDNGSWTWNKNMLKK